MKKTYIILVLSILCLIADAQEYVRLNDGAVMKENTGSSPKIDIEEFDDGIRVTYQFDYAKKINDDIYTSTSILLFEGFGISEGSGIPALPIKKDVFFVPTTQSCTVSLIDSSFVELPIEISPAKPPVINGVSPNFSKENVKSITPYSGYFPCSVLSSNVNPYRSNGIADVFVKPILYNYATKTVRAYKKISYLISWNKSNVDTKQSQDNVENDLFLSNITINKKKEIYSKATKSSVQITPPKYLIVTVPEYIGAANKFANWKRTLGYDVTVATQDIWLENNVTNTIASVCPDYLLIIGEEEDVPAHSCADTIYTSLGWQTYQYFTDYYYGCVQQNTYPEIRRGRIPVSSASVAMTVVDKIIQYEREPIQDSLFYSTGLNCAYFQDLPHSVDGHYLPTDSIEDVRFTLTSENIREYLVAEQNKTINRVYTTKSYVTPYYWNNDYYGYRNVKVPIPEELRRSNGFPWCGQQDSIKKYINEGAFYILHRDHGAVNMWGDPYFTSTHINQLSNGKKLPIVFSMNCKTGRYPYNTCFAETFLQKESGGCVAIFAATETSFSGYNDALVLGMFDAIWPFPGFVKSFPYNYSLTLSSVPSYRLGDILDIGLSEIPTIWSLAGSKAYKHTKEIFHCFGDPSMEIYTELPTPFSDATFEVNNGVIYVSVNEEATITFFNPTTNTVQSYKGISATSPNSSGLRVCVSAHNKIPLIFENDTLFIQNESFLDSTSYEADNIKVGSNVTSLKNVGAVKITNGSVRLKGKTVELSGETEVSLGAQFEITN